MIGKPQHIILYTQVIPMVNMLLINIMVINHYSFPKQTSQGSNRPKGTHNIMVRRQGFMKHQFL
jgi:hypothetical protein